MNDSLFIDSFSSSEIIFSPQYFLKINWESTNFQIITNSFQFSPPKEKIDQFYIGFHFALFENSWFIFINI